MPELIDSLYISITFLSVVGIIFALRFLLALRRHYVQIEDFGAAVGFLKSDKFLQFIQVLSISILLWLASILSTVGVAVREAGHVITRVFELLAIISFIVGCHAALEVVQKYEKRKKR